MKIDSIAKITYNRTIRGSVLSILRHYDVKFKIFLSFELRGSGLRASGAWQGYDLRLKALP